jgi:serine protease Do
MGSMLAAAVGVVLVGSPVQSESDRPIISDEAASTLNMLSDAFVAVAQHAGPYVVSITTETEIEAHSGSSPFPGFEEFFGRRGRPDGANEPFRQQGQGSGLIVSADGYILTNNHVAGNADELKVELQDGRIYKAELIGADSMSDVAVIRIEPDEPLAYARLGDSESLRVGEWVIAVGSPFRLEQTVTAGIVSAMGRGNVNLSVYEDFIQTDAAINPGNSGGPLVNLKGEVVGVNTAIATRSGGYQGIGFAIPINMANKIMEDLINDGRVTRGWLGVGIDAVDEDLADAMGLDRPHGALVNNVIAPSPSENAGVVEGDVIVKFDGEDIRDPQHLMNRVALTRPGETSEVVVTRDGKEQTFFVTLGERPAEEDLATADPRRNPGVDTFGLELTPLTRDLAEGLGAEMNEGGLLVDSVAPGSPAAEKGIQPGDIVRQAAKEPITSVREFREQVRELESDETLLLLVERDGRTRFHALRKS